jgi:hypothetical protein
VAHGRCSRYVARIFRSHSHKIAPIAKRENASPRALGAQQGHANDECHTDDAANGHVHPQWTRQDASRRVVWHVADAHGCDAVVSRVTHELARNNDACSLHA